MTSLEFVNFYELLQVPSSASADDVRAAVRKQRRQWVKRQASADPAKRTEAEAKVRQIDLAEKTLLDPTKRSAFDRELANWRPTAPAEVGDGSSNLLERAKAYLEQGNVSAAHTAATKAINQNGVDDVAWYVRAHASFLMGQARDAEYEFAEAIRLRPDNPDYHYDLGDVYFQQEKWGDALREFEAAMRFEPTNPQYRTAIAQVYGMNHEVTRALEIMEAVVAEHPQDEVFRYYLAAALYDSTIEATTEFSEGHLATSEAQVALAEHNAARIEGLGLANAEILQLAENLRIMAQESRKTRWRLYSSHWKAYVITLGILLLLVVFGQTELVVVGVIGIVALVVIYVFRHRKPTWQHRHTVLADQIVKAGI